MDHGDALHNYSHCAVYINCTEGVGMNSIEFITFPNKPVCKGPGPVVTNHSQDIRCFFLQDFVHWNITQLLIG